MLAMHPVCERPARLRRGRRDEGPVACGQGADARV